MPSDLKADLLRLLSPDCPAMDLTELRARLQSATVTEPGPVVVESSKSLKEAISDFFTWLVVAKRITLPAHLAARVNTATITEPPPPDPCVVECGTITTQIFDGHCLRIEDADRTDAGVVDLTRTEAAALIPALQAFVREGGV